MLIAIINSIEIKINSPYLLDCGYGEFFMSFILKIRLRFVLQLVALKDPKS